MKFSEYFSSKAITLCFLGIGAAVFMVFMGSGGVKLAFMLQSLLLFSLITAAWLFCGYRIARRKLRKLEVLLNGLSEKYLLGEILPAPHDPVEQKYFTVMQTVSRAAVGAAENAVREKNEYCDYVASWIHEMKTPLTACSLILANGGDPRKLKKELKRADNLTESILYYARLRTMERDTVIRETAVSPVLHDAVQSQMELLVAAGIGVEIAGDFTVHTDEKALCFIVKQLLINTAKYCSGCRIAITAERGSITVYDDGVGIPAHEIGRVSDRGYTGTAGRLHGGSTGMGLYIVNNLCAQLGIGFDIEAEEGKYTRVTLCFDYLTKP